MNLAEKLKEQKAKSQESKRGTGPLWKGPEVDGITFSLLSRFIACPERFRILVTEGLQPHDEFNHRIEYGNMWHTCEEAALRVIGSMREQIEVCFFGFG